MIGTSVKNGWLIRGNGARYFDVGNRQIASELALYRFISKM